MKKETSLLLWAAAMVIGNCAIILLGFIAAQAFGGALLPALLVTFAVMVFTFMTTYFWPDA